MPSYLDQIDTLRGRQKELARILTKLEKEYTTLKNRIADIKLHIEDLEEEQAEGGMGLALKISDLRGTLKEAIKNYEDLGNSIDTYQDRYDEVTEERRALQIKIEGTYYDG